MDASAAFATAAALAVAAVSTAAAAAVAGGRPVYRALGGATPVRGGRRNQPSLRATEGLMVTADSDAVAVVSDGSSRWLITDGIFDYSNETKSYIHAIERAVQGAGSPEFEVVGWVDGGDAAEMARIGITAGHWFVRVLSMTDAVTSDMADILNTLHASARSSGKTIDRVTFVSSVTVGQEFVLHVEDALEYDNVAALLNNDLGIDVSIFFDLSFMKLEISRRKALEILAMPPDLDYFDYRRQLPSGAVTPCFDAIAVGLGTVDPDQGALCGSEDEVGAIDFSGPMAEFLRSFRREVRSPVSHLEGEHANGPFGPVIDHLREMLPTAYYTKISGVFRMRFDPVMGKDFDVYVSHDRAQEGECSDSLCSPDLRYPDARELDSTPLPKVGVFSQTSGACFLHSAFHAIACSTMSAHVQAFLRTHVSPEEAERLVRLRVGHLRDSGGVAAVVDVIQAYRAHEDADHTSHIRALMLFLLRNMDSLLDRTEEAVDAEDAIAQACSAYEMSLQSGGSFTGGNAWFALYDLIAGICDSPVTFCLSASFHIPSATYPEQTINMCPPADEDRRGSLATILERTGTADAALLAMPGHAVCGVRDHSKDTLSICDSSLGQLIAPIKPFEIRNDEDKDFLQLLWETDAIHVESLVWVEARGNVGSTINGGARGRPAGGGAGSSLTLAPGTRRTVYTTPRQHVTRQVARQHVARPRRMALMRSRVGTRASRPAYAPVAQATRTVHALERKARRELLTVCLVAMADRVLRRGRRTVR